MVVSSTSRADDDRYRSLCVKYAGRTGILIPIFINPIVYALFDKRIRCHILIRGVPENQILEVLSAYGLLEDTLPTEMGSTFELDQSERIGNRWAAEIEDI